MRATSGNGPAGFCKEKHEKGGVPYGKISHDRQMGKPRRKPATSLINRWSVCNRVQSTEKKKLQQKILQII